MIEGRPFRTVSEQNFPHGVFIASEGNFLRLIGDSMAKDPEWTVSRHMPFYHRGQVGPPVLQLERAYRRKRAANVGRRYLRGQQVAEADRGGKLLGLR